MSNSLALNGLRATIPLFYCRSGNIANLTQESITLLVCLIKKDRQHLVDEDLRKIGDEVSVFECICSFLADPTSEQKQVPGWHDLDSLVSDINSEISRKTKERGLPCPNHLKLPR